MERIYSTAHAVGVCSLQPIDATNSQFTPPDVTHLDRLEFSRVSRFNLAVS